MPNRRQQALRIIISGGGTGGHIFPAIAIANALKEQNSKNEILFVGAEGRMEMEKVPQAGYEIKGLPIAGLQRRFTWSNFSFPFKLFKSLAKAKRIIKDFNPDIVVGVGGYASGPVLWQAQSLGIANVIQEQNSYAGLTNKLLARKADCICTAYEGMEQFFDHQKIQLTGNPIRQDLFNLTEKRMQSLSYFNLNDSQYTLLVIGGSLGAKIINESILNGLDQLKLANIQVIWQTGKAYYQQLRSKVNAEMYPNVKIFEFIQDMSQAFAAADLIVSRAGAGTISELCVVAKAVILIPSPNVAEDHQTKNAMALVNKGAAQMLTDNEAESKLVNQVIELSNKPAACEQLGKNISLLAKPLAANSIAQIIEHLARRKRD